MSTGRRVTAATLFPVRPNRGENGRLLCRVCGVEVPSHRQTLCSPECVKTLRLATDESYVRSLVRRRDRGVCSRCGLDTAAFGRALDEWYGDIKRLHVARGGKSHSPEFWQRWMDRLQYQDDVVSLAHQALVSLGLARFLHRDAWEMHHKHAVVEGGAHTLDNLETLCYRCHAAETADLARRRADVRRGRVPLVEDRQMEMVV